MGWEEFGKISCYNTWDGNNVGKYYAIIHERRGNVGKYHATIHEQGGIWE